MRSGKAGYGSMGASSKDFSFCNIFLGVGMFIAIALGSAGLGVSLWHHSTTNHVDLQIPAQATNSTDDDNDEGLLIYNPVTQEYSLLTGDNTGQKLEWSNLHNAWMLSPVIRERIGHIFYNDVTLTDLTGVYQDIISDNVYIAKESPYWDITYNITTGEIELSGVRFDNSSVDYIPPTVTASEFDLDGTIDPQSQGPLYKLHFNIMAQIRDVTTYPLVMDIDLEQCTDFEDSWSFTSPSQGSVEFTEEPATSSHLYTYSFYAGFPALYIGKDNPLCFKFRVRDDLETAVIQLDLDLRELVVELEFLTV